MKLPPLILASTSPRRQELLRQLGLEFVVVRSDAEEVQHEQLTVREAAQVNAYRKARAVAKKFPDALVLGADTLVCLGTKMFGKPADLANAHRMLAELSDRTHEVVTGVCLLHLRAHRQRMFHDRTAVKFRALADADIQRYFAHVNPLDKAGAYAIQEHGESLVAEVSGSYGNVMGLPVEKVCGELAAWPKIA